MKKFTGAVNFLLGALCMLLIVSQFSFRNNEPEPPAEGQPGMAEIEMKHKWLPPSFPENLSFAGEPAPLDRWDVRERFERELLLNYYSPGNIIYMIKLAKKNFPVISERLKANGVPDDFKYLCIAESNMQSWAVSRAGAVGYWQFMDGTAPGYGLETSAQVDERMHLEKSTDAASKYLKQAYSRFGNWTAAAASYNCGMGGYNSQATFQQTRNYYDLHLPEETNRYIFRILAFKYLIENADKLGYIVEDKEKFAPVPFRTMTITATIPDLARFAISHGTTYKMLRAMNPWLKGRSLPVKQGRSYVIRLPAQ